MANTMLIEIDDKEVRRALAGLVKYATNPQAGLKVIGERMLRHTDDSFTKETSPAGTKWKAVQESTAKRKRNPKILTELGETGGLRGTIAYALQDSDTLLVGANKPYAAIHQLGGKAGRGGKATIPARPFLGVSAAAKEDINDVVMQALKKAAQG